MEVASCDVEGDERVAAVDGLVEDGVVAGLYVVVAVECDGVAHVDCVVDVEAVGGMDGEVEVDEAVAALLRGEGVGVGAGGRVSLSGKGGGGVVADGVV